MEELVLLGRQVLSDEKEKDLGGRRDPYLRLDDHAWPQWYGGTVVMMRFPGPNLEDLIATSQTPFSEAYIDLLNALKKLPRLKKLTHSTFLSEPGFNVVEKAVIDKHATKHKD